MNLNRLLLALLLLGPASAFPLAAQPPRADRELFAQVKAKADKGDAEAQLRLGNLYATGTGVARDPAKAAKWHRKAAEQGLARAQYQLGLDYADGFGLKANQAEAVQWFRQAAEQGLVEAQLDLGLCYVNGSGVRENGVEAVRWFRKAADAGSPGGKYELGQCYFEGTGVAKNIAEALKWIQEAAEEGYALAQNRLGACYEKGEGVSRDYVQAYKWFDLAAAQDDLHAPDIRVSLAKVETAMTKEEVAEAQRLAREFRPAVKTDARATGSGQGQPGSGEASGAGGKTNSAERVSTPAGSPATGFVNVRADDERSEVFVDGAFVGNPPARVKLTEGAHVIEVKKPGFKDYRREMRVGAGSDLTLRVVLERQ